jgi:hypothetical protein
MTVATVRVCLRQTAVMDREIKKFFRKQVEQTSLNIHRREKK